MTNRRQNSIDMNANAHASLTSSLIAYEDDFLLIIDKPPGMLTHPTVSERGATLYDLVKKYYDESGINAGIHPVSRLDRNTSGLVIFAKEPIIQFWLSQRHIHKEYYAVITAELPASSGVIEAPVARKSGSIIERCVDYDNGHYAKTLFEVAGNCNGKTLVKLVLCTGRTHQLRVHMAHIGCPLLGDNLYGNRGPQSRHALHAYKLIFNHPVSDRILEITRKIPQDMEDILYSKTH